MKAVLKVMAAIRYIQAINKRAKDQKGLTLVELMIVLVFISLIVTLVSTIFLSSSRTSNDVINITRSQIDARLALYRMSKDIREAGSFSIADADHIRFLSNIDADEDYEEVDYYLESEEGYYLLVKTVDGGSQTIVISHLVNNDIFKYFLEINTPENGIEPPLSSEDMDSIKLIGLDVSIDQSGTPGPRTMDLDTLIALRNRI
jgi:prepilin-type N-terminal cleavage/methylation domain-containing protein